VADGCSLAEQQSESVSTLDDVSEIDPVRRNPAKRVIDVEASGARVGHPPGNDGCPHRPRAIDRVVLIPVVLLALMLLAVVLLAVVLLALALLAMVLLAVVLLAVVLLAVVGHAGEGGTNGARTGRLSGAATIGLVLTRLGRIAEHRTNGCEAQRCARGARAAQRYARGVRAAPPAAPPRPASLPRTPSIGPSLLRLRETR